MRFWKKLWTSLYSQCFYELTLKWRATDFQFGSSFTHCLGPTGLQRQTYSACLLLHTVADIKNYRGNIIKNGKHFNLSSIRDFMPSNTSFTTLHEFYHIFMTNAGLLRKVVLSVAWLKIPSAMTNWGPKYISSLCVCIIQLFSWNLLPSFFTLLKKTGIAVRIRWKTSNFKMTQLIN